MQWKFKAKVSRRTLILLLLSLTGLASYLFFPQLLYLFHTFFLNRFTAGLSLTKPLLFFFFLMFVSLLYDILPLKKFVLRKWIFLQVSFGICILLLAVLGFMVFKSNFEAYTSNFPNPKIPLNMGGIIYTSYDAKTMFFYTVSHYSHNHENKALLYPLSQYLGLQGDVGEAIFPFYPIKARIPAYLLLAAILIIIFNSLLMLKASLYRHKLETALIVYYSFILWRVLHIIFDGGLFSHYFFNDLAMILAFTLLLLLALKYIPPIYAYSYPLLYFLLVLPLAYLTRALFNISRPLIDLKLTIPYLLEVIIALAIVSILTEKDFSWRGYMTQIKKDSRLALITMLLCFSLFLYLIQLSAIANITVLDDSSRYDSQPVKPDFLVATTSKVSNPCNYEPYKKYIVGPAHVFIYNFTSKLECEKKTYIFPTQGKSPPNYRFIVDCNNIASIPFKIREQNNICSLVIQNPPQFFRYAIAKDLKGAHIYLGFKIVRPPFLKQNI